MKIYRHLNNGKPYLKLVKSKVKIEGEWKEAIIYLCLYLNKDGMIWVRTIEDFEHNFK
jgi:hypothetical protein